jgi:Flp pilus assembly pilin Flp
LILYAAKMVMSKFASLLPTNERGQTLVEYALIIALVSVFLVIALVALAGGIEAAFNAVIEALEAAIGGGGTT